MNLSFEQLRPVFVRVIQQPVYPGDVCPTEDILAAYGAGLLSQAQRTLLEQHLAECSPCRRDLQALSEAGAWFDQNELRILSGMATKGAWMGLLPWCKCPSMWLVHRHVWSQIPATGKGKAISAEIEQHVNRCPTCRQFAHEFRSAMEGHHFTLSDLAAGTVSTVRDWARSFADGLLAAAAATGSPSPAPGPPGERGGEPVSLFAPVLALDGLVLIGDDGLARQCRFDIAQADVAPDGFVTVKLSTSDRRYRGPAAGQHDVELRIFAGTAVLEMGREPVDEDGYVAFTGLLPGAGPIDPLPISLLDVQVHSSQGPPEITSVGLEQFQATDQQPVLADTQSSPAEHPIGLSVERGPQPGEGTIDSSQAQAETPLQTSSVRNACPPAPVTSCGRFGWLRRWQTDRVDCTVFAPPQARVGDALLVQVFVHLPSHLAKATELAQEFDPTAGRRGFSSLGTRIRRGSRLTFELAIPPLEVDCPVSELIWLGRPEAVQFAVRVNPDLPPQVVLGTVLVSQDTVPIGRIIFKLNVVGQGQSAASESVPTGQGQRYDLAFISYASKDRPEVLRRVPMLTAVGIRFFQDVLSLEPGDEWLPKLYGHIDKSDVFLLFWSTNAKESDWVAREWKHALSRDEKDFIRPVIIEGPPIPLPPPELAHLHFSDRSIYLIRPS